MEVQQQIREHDTAQLVARPNAYAKCVGAHVGRAAFWGLAPNDFHPAVTYMMRSGGCIYLRGNHRRKPVTGPQLLPESFWTRFGPDTAVVDTNYEPPRVTTYTDLGRQKRERQAENLRRKRVNISEVIIRPLYVWVFHCPGLDGFYKGWWTYLWGRGWDSGKYLSRDGKLIRQLMELFPLGQCGLFGPNLTYEQWEVRFAKAFCCRNADGTPRKHAGRIQGKAFVWAEFHGAHFTRILGRADWAGLKWDCPIRRLTSSLAFSLTDAGSPTGG